MKKAFALGRQAPVAADTDTATSVGVCLDQEKVPIDAYWLTWEDELLKDAGPIWLPFTLRISTNDMVITLPLPTGGISVGKAETCDVRVRAEALVPRLLKVVPEGHFARVHLARGFDFCTVWLHGQPVFDGDKLWRGDAMDLEGMRIELQ
jgi:hypothetical protein